MTAAALPHLVVLAAAGEKSKVPFYIVGGVLAAWAVTVSFLGLRRSDFPGTPGRARAVMATSVVLVLAAVSTAVATSSHPPKAGGATSGTAGRGPAPPTGAGSAPRPGRGGASTATSTVALAADPTGQLHFTTSSLRAKAGRVTVHFTNQSAVAHNVTIQTQSGQFVAGTATISGSSTSVTANLSPGTYTYYCSVDSHRQAGMQGTLVVG